ncbi:MAG: DUF427 domain-containing protein [Alphaproteobacteria bacterium]
MPKSAIFDRTHAGHVREKDGPHIVEIENSPRRVRAMFGGETIADSSRPLLVLETGCLPVYYFPRADIRMDLLVPTDHRTTCPYKGEAAYWTVKAGGRSAENAAWSYPTPIPESAALGEAIAFYWNRIDHWYEEDEEIFVHPRSPYHRVDVVQSHRHVEVVVRGEVVGESRRARFLFETGLPPRFYLPPEDLKPGILSPSETTSRCPYKGVAAYHDVTVRGETLRDLVWTYPDPIPECPAIRGLLCFYNEFVDEIRVDGVPVEKSATPWSRARAGS